MTPDPTTERLAKLLNDAETRAEMMVLLAENEPRLITLVREATRG